MERDKKAESAKVVGYFCIGLALLLLLSAIVLLTSGRSEPGLMFLVVGIALLPIGIVTVAQGKRKSTSTS